MRNMNMEKRIDEIKQTIRVRKEKTIKTDEWKTTILKTDFGCVILQKTPYRNSEIWLTKSELEFVNVAMSDLDIDLNVIA
jgi:hypothetical protein